MDKKLFAPNLTFFNYNGSVNYNMISEHISWLLENNINGLFMTGTYGLGPSLSVDESLRIYEIANKHENLINIAQISKASILETLDLIKGSNEIGVHNFASVVPYYYNYSNFEIIDYFKELKKHINGNIFLYNNPKTTKFNLSISLLNDLIQNGIDGIKDSSLNCQIVSAALHEKSNNENFKVMVGSSIGWNLFRNNNIDAMISGMCNYIPELAAKVFSLSMQKDDEFNYAYSVMYNLYMQLSKYDSVALSYAVLKTRVNKEYYIRAPKQIGINDSDLVYIRDVIATAYKKLNIYDYFKL